MFGVIYYTLKAEYIPKNKRFIAENNAETRPIQLQNNLEKVKKTTLTLKWSEMTPRNSQKAQNFDQKFQFFG